MSNSGENGAPAGKSPTRFLRGVHHLVFNTEDMKRTMDFYIDVLGCPLVHALKVPPGLGTGPDNRGNPPWENLRHYFFDMGGDSLIAFFEIPRGAKPPGDRNTPGSMQHVAFAVSAKNFRRMSERLRQNGIEVDGPVEVAPSVYSLYFLDPNGVRLELCCRPEDGDTQHVVDSLAQSRVAALGELRTLHSETAWLNHVTKSLDA